MDANDIKKVLIIGSGTMGQQIGAACAIAGLEVNMYDVNAVYHTEVWRSLWILEV